MYEIGHFIGGKKCCRHQRPHQRTSITRRPAKFRRTVALAKRRGTGRLPIENAQGGTAEAWAAINPQRRARVFMKFVRAS